MKHLTRLLGLGFLAAAFGLMATPVAHAQLVNPARDFGTIVVKKVTPGVNVPEVVVKAPPVVINTPAVIHNPTGTNNPTPDVPLVMAPHPDTYDIDVAPTVNQSSLTGHNYNYGTVNTIDHSTVPNVIATTNTGNNNGTNQEGGPADTPGGGQNNNGNNDTAENDESDSSSTKHKTAGIVTKKQTADTYVGVGYDTSSYTKTYIPLIPESEMIQVPEKTEKVSKERSSDLGASATGSGVQVSLVAVLGVVLVIMGLIAGARSLNNQKQKVVVA